MASSSRPFNTAVTALLLLTISSAGWALSSTPNPVILQIDDLNVPNGAVALTLDDGTAESAIGDSGQFIWFNRFTPAATDFPFELAEVSALIGSTMVNVGDSLEIVVYEDTDGDGDPGTGAVLLDSFSATVQFNDLATLNVYSLATPVQLSGPGDVLIGLINRSGSEGFDDFPAALDTTASQQRSWAASYLAGDAPVNPPLPADEQFGTIDSFGLPGNWVLRGAGNPLFTIGGNLTGLTSGSVDLLLNNVETLTVSADGPFTFMTALADGAPYTVQVTSQPPNQNCSLSNEFGNVSASNVTNITLNCSVLFLPPATIPTTGWWALVLLAGLMMLVVRINLRRSVEQR